MGIREAFKQFVRGEDVQGAVAELEKMQSTLETICELGSDQERAMASELLIQVNVTLNDLNNGDSGPFRSVEYPNDKRTR